ncbi:MAG: hypothetical protein ABIO46_09445 [Chitinophagales bacterium]
MENTSTEEPIGKSRGKRFKRIAQMIYLGFISSILFIAAAMAL